MKEILLILLLILIWAIIIEPSILITTEYEYKLPALAGQKAVVASDFHFRNKKQVMRVVKKINEQDADYVFYLGDYTERVPIKYVEKALSGVKAKFGIYSVLGNHDEEDIELPNMLNNRSVKVNGVNIVGIEFYKPDIKTPGEPAIYLCHNPDMYKYIPDGSLILSGHTHGGQITLFGRPFVTPSVYGFGRGLYFGHMIITSGVGANIIPARLFCPPEIVVIKFVK